MAEVQKKLKKATARGTAGGARKKPGAKMEGGTERLRQAADRRVGKSSTDLANLLVEKALAGDLPSTRMLLALAENKKMILDVETAEQSLALLLRAEPEIGRLEEGREWKAKNQGR